MANVEIYIINKETKDIECVAEIPGAMSFMLHFWTKMEMKFLPPYNPKDENITRFVGSLTAFFNPEKPNPMQEIWDLGFDTNVPKELRLLMKMTLDHSYVPYEHILEMADIVDNCEFANPVYKNVAAAMRQIHSEYPKILGITFNGTSVVSMEEIYDKSKLWNIFDIIDIPSMNLDEGEIKPV
jgi:hypothetical protein